MTRYVADLSWKSGARAIEKLDRLRSTMAVNVLIFLWFYNFVHQFGIVKKCFDTVDARYKHEELVCIYHCALKGVGQISKLEHLRPHGDNGMSPK